jgi:Papain family cysteine protease
MTWLRGVQLASYGKVDEPGEAAMKNEILQRGPIVCSIATDGNFVYNYRSGVYQGPDSTDVDHNVEVRSSHSDPLLRLLSQGKRCSLDEDVTASLPHSVALAGCMGKMHWQDALLHGLFVHEEILQVVGWGFDKDAGPYWHVRNSWGSFWGEMGFFKVGRGSNFLSLEAGDCWFAIPTWDMEKQVAEGALGGTMYGVVELKNKSGETSSVAATQQADAAGNILKTTAKDRAASAPVLAQQKLMAQALRGQGSGNH